MIQNTKSSVSFPPIFQIFLLFFVQKHHWNNFLLYSYPFDYTGNGKTRGEAMIGVIASPNINPGKLALLATSTHNCYYVTGYMKLSGSCLHPIWLLYINNSLKSIANHIFLRKTAPIPAHSGMGELSMGKRRVAMKRAAGYEPPAGLHTGTKTVETLKLRGLAGVNPRIDAISVCDNPLKYCNCKISRLFGDS